MKNGVQGPELDARKIFFNFTYRSHFSIPSEILCLHLMDPANLSCRV